MCGILGLCSSEIVSFEKFKGSLDKIAHRGPDGHGIWCNENKNVMLGHRRLSIIDLSDNAHQPMVLGNRYVLTFNGEIYNYLELKKELELKGSVFKSCSDTEVILALYSIYGISFLNKLNGMWAFGLYDIHEDILFLSRDRIGKKPLFYFKDENKLVFASEMKALYSFLPKVIPNFEVVLKAKSYSSPGTFPGYPKLPNCPFGEP